ncbi:HNH endonuclease [Pseudomonas viridiflava]|uniref:HNH endonuclease n=1 Tax=Pseudomonas viridiflava TaxID=33069 RepID=UPI000F02CB9F|nr:HNH endonuclease [Pseudomonas viridiflava]
MARCIYCRIEKEAKELTLEHVIPQFLGGAHAPELFKTRDVCKKCNSNLGLFVDASFEKNWMVSNWLRQASSAFYSKDSPVGVSLVCMGSADFCPPELPENHVCELWLGPAGEQVFWLRPSDSRLSAYVGGNPRTTKTLETRAYFLFSENTHLDPLKTWLSFEQAFVGHKVKKVLCGEVEGVDASSIGFSEPDDLDSARWEFFQAIGECHKSRHQQVLVDPIFDHRFLCKMSIAIAYCLFGPKTLESDYGKELFKGVWHKKDDDDPQVLGSALFSKENNENFNALIGYPNLVVIALLSTPDGVAVNLNIGSQLNWTVLCARNEDLTPEDHKKIDGGKVLVLARPIQKGVYLDLPSYVAHKCNLMAHDELNSIIKYSGQDVSI